MLDIFNLKNVVGAIINSIAYIYIWSRLLNKKINFKQIKYYIFTIILAILMILNHYFVDDFIGIIVQIIFMTILCAKLYKEKYINSFITVFIAQLIIMISELLFVLILTLFNIDSAEFVMQSFEKTVLVNIVVSVFSIAFSMLKFIRNLNIKFIGLISNISDKVKILILILILTSVNFAFLAMYKSYNLNYVLIINIIITAIYLFICFKVLFIENKYNNIKEKYNTTLNSLKEYEDVLDKYRVSNHENKNQLLTIRNMLPKTNKKTISYIDTILENNQKDNNKVMKDTFKIPSGGLRGLIYSKLLLMENNNIKHELNISKEVKTSNFIKISDSTMLDICKIIGVYLDNSIQAVKKLKNKIISIDMYIENKELVIEVSNTYSGKIDLDKIENKGYTTKGKNHGYGLSLSKEIIDNNNLLKNEKKISKEIFTQVLKIKM